MGYYIYHVKYALFFLWVANMRNETYFSLNNVLKIIVFHYFWP